MRKALSGGGNAVAIADGLDSPTCLAVSSTRAFYGLSGGSIAYVPQAGGATPTPLASGQPSLAYMAIDSTNVYWTNISAPSSVMKVAIAGGSPMPLYMNATDRI